MLGGLTQLVTLRAIAWEEGARPSLPASLRHLELLGIELGHGGRRGYAPLPPIELSEEVEAPRCIQRVLPAGTKLRVRLHLCYGQRLREWGGLQSLLARLDAQLRGWAELQEAVGRRLELSMELSGMYYQAGYGGGNMERGLDRPLPALIKALAPVAASIHTLCLASVSTSWVPPCQRPWSAPCPPCETSMFPPASYMTVWWPLWHSCGSCASCASRPLSAEWMSRTGASWLLPWQVCWLTGGRC